jgi:hypothetical protein
VCAGIGGMKIRNLFLALLGEALVALGYEIFQENFNILNDIAKFGLGVSMVILVWMIFRKIMGQKNESTCIREISVYFIIFSVALTVSTMIIGFGKIFGKMSDVIWIKLMSFNLLIVDLLIDDFLDKTSKYFIIFSVALTTFVVTCPVIMIFVISDVEKFSDGVLFIIVMVIMGFSLLVAGIIVSKFFKKLKTRHFKETISYPREIKKYIKMLDGIEKRLTLLR